MTSVHLPFEEVLVIAKVIILKVSETNFAGKHQEYQEKFCLKQHEIQSPENKASTDYIKGKTHVLFHSLPQQKQLGNWK